MGQKCLLYTRSTQPVAHHINLQNIYLKISLKSVSEQKTGLKREVMCDSEMFLFQHHCVSYSIVVSENKTKSKVSTKLLYFSSCTSIYF